MSCRFAGAFEATWIISGQKEASLTDKTVVDVGEDVVVVADAGAELAQLQARLVRAELKAAAITAGIVDVDGIALVDMSTVKMNESGELVDGPGVMRALRAAKPWLFGGSSSSSVAVAPPRGPVSEAKTAMKMSTEEWRAARAELLRRR